MMVIARSLLSIINFQLSISKMPVFIKVSQNKITDSKSYGKWYGRVVSSKTMTYQELCKHMSEHNSVYGEDVCLGVANKLQNCMLEQLLEGKKVQFGELGVFYLSVKSSGAAEEKDFNLGVNINGLYLCFAPSRTDVNNLSSKMLKKKATFMNVKDLSETKPKKPSATDPDDGSDTTDSSGDGGTTDDDTTGGSSNTSGGNDNPGGNNDNPSGGGDNSGGDGGDDGAGLDQD